jgi:hypothetical protein
VLGESVAVRDRALVVAAGIAGVLLFLLTRESLTDDAYITLAYAKNLALHLHWGLIPQETANTQTSPLAATLLAALSAVTRIGHGVHPVAALGVLLAAAAMATAWAWTRVVRALDLPWATAVLGLALALADPFLLSSVGLEVVLMPALLALLLAMALEGRPAGYGLVSGAMLLTRLDLAVFVIAAGLASAPIRREWRRVLLVGGAVAGPWFIASWVLLGSAIPDTLIVKVDQGGAIGRLDYLTAPIDYLRVWPWEVSLALAPALLGLAGLAAWLVARWTGRLDVHDREALAPVAAIGLGGIAYYVVYSAISVPGYHWYYVAPITALTMVAVVLGGSWTRTASRARLRWRGAALAPVGVLGVLAVATLASDLAHGVPWRAPVIFGNFASAHDYARVGIALRGMGNTGVASPGEIGTLAYFCNCAILDEFSDRGAVVRRVNGHLEHGTTLARALLGVNYLWLDRDQAPRRPRWALVYGRGPGPGWQVWSAAYGHGHLQLVRRRPTE